MLSWRTRLIVFLLSFLTVFLHAQERDSSFSLIAIIYDEAFNPIPATHVININSHVGDVSDSLGIFSMPVQLGDTLLFRNIAYLEIRVPVNVLMTERYVILKRSIYPLQEAKVFPWGSSYEDFSRALIRTPAPETLGEALGLPRQDPDYVPFDMRSSELKSAAFLFSSPVSFLYYNLSKKEKNRRKLYWDDKNRERQKIFDEILSKENLGDITGLGGDPLITFMTFLFQRMVCDFRCTELKIYTEIYAHWEVFQQLHPEIVGGG